MKIVDPRVERLLQVPQPAQRTPEWYEARKTLMTASVCASALGIKPFESFTGDPRADAIANTVYRKFKGNVATRWGCDHEDEVRDRFDAIMGKKSLDFGLVRHSDVPRVGDRYDWLAASPDGITTDGEMVEIKCPYRRQIVEGEVPHHYLPQVQVQLEVCDLDVCYFVQWQPADKCDGGVEVFDITVVERDREWFARHSSALLSFFEELQAARAAYVPPPPPVCLVVDDLYVDLVSSPPTTTMNTAFLDDDDDSAPVFLVDDSE